MSEPKSRTLTLDVHVLAYLGDYMTMLEESVKRLALEEVKKQQNSKQDGSVPADPKCTASSRNHS
jgi:hypothetical protein